MAGPRSQIANALEDLSPGDLERFSARLKERRDDKHTPERFRQGQLIGKNHQGLADLLVDSFSGNAVPITVALLRAICANRVADDLEEDAKAVPVPKSQSSAGASAAPAMTAGASAASAKSGRASGATAREGHFVDRNRIALIERVSNIAPILDHLQDTAVLGDEQYSDARAERTPQAKMRFLFNGPLKSGGVRGKDELLSALKEHERYLIEDLEEKEG